VPFVARPATKQRCSRHESFSNCAVLKSSPVLCGCLCLMLLVHGLRSQTGALNGDKQGSRCCCDSSQSTL
jgi:hypothetical protein